MKPSSQNIFLLASTEDDLRSMKEILLRASPELSNNITGEFDCLKALQAINSPDFKIKIISPTDDSSCVTKNIYHLVLNRSTEKDFKIILDREFSIRCLPVKTSYF